MESGCVKVMMLRMIYQNCCNGRRVLPFLNNFFFMKTHLSEPSYLFP